MVLSIRPYALSDAAALFEAATESTAEVFPWLPWCHPGYELAEAQSWIEHQVQAFTRAEQFEFVIQSASGDFLGGCGVNLLDSVHLRANLGYWVRSSATGRGIAPAAARLAAKWAFANTDLVRLEIITSVQHARSQRVAEKAGAQREGVLRKRLLLHGVHHDAVVYSLLRPEPSTCPGDPVDPAPVSHELPSLSEPAGGCAD